MCRSERVRFTYSTIGSGVMHLTVVVVLLLLSLINIEPIKPPEEQKPIEVEFTSDADGQGNPAKAEQDSPNPNAPAKELLDAPPSPQPPINAPTEETPPPPPPPQPMPPMPKETPQLTLNTQDIPQTMEMNAPSEVQVPPSPMLAPSKAQNNVASPSPMPVPDALPQVQAPSHLTITEKAKRSVPDTHSLMATLDSYQADMKQTHAPTARANPRQGGAPNGGGSRHGDITKALTSGQQGRIAASVRRCYTEDTDARNYAQFTARLIVTVDATGEARMVEFDPSTKAKMNSDPSYQALAERARDAVMSPTCSKLPIPNNLLGKTAKIRFVFRP